MTVRKHRRGLALPTLLAGAVVLAATPAALLASLFWAVDGNWEFEGRGMRHWVFVSGSHLDRLGSVDATGAPVRYSVSLAEGTFPGWRIATYASAASPAGIVAAYAERCRELGLKVTQAPGAPPGDAQASLVCEIEPYLDAEFVAERENAASPTRVTVKVWGSD